jgi:hypothetical protein
MAFSAFISKSVFGNAAVAIDRPRLQDSTAGQELQARMKPIALRADLSHTGFPISVLTFARAHSLRPWERRFEAGEIDLHYSAYGTIIMKANTEWKDEVE